MATKVENIVIKFDVQGTANFVAAEKSVSKLQRGVTKFNKTNREMDAAVGKVGRSSKASSRALQNVAFQVQDVAVQLQGGVDIMFTLSQQLPQALVGFGALGAVIGGVIAVGGAMINMLVDGGEKIGKFAAEADEAESALSAFRDVAKELNSPLEDLEKSYGKLTEVAKRYLTIIKEISNAEYIKQVNDQAIAIKQSVEGFGSLGRFTLVNSDLFSDLEDLKDKGVDVRNALLGVTAVANGPESHAKGNIALLAEEMIKLRDAGVEMTPAMTDFIKSSSELKVNSIELAKVLKDVEDGVFAVNDELKKGSSKEFKDDMDSMVGVWEDWNLALDRSAQALKDSQNNFNAYSTELNHINLLLDTNRITADQAAQAMFDLDDKFSGAAKSVKKLKKEVEELTPIFGSLFNGADTIGMQQYAETVERINELMKEADPLIEYHDKSQELHELLAKGLPYESYVILQDELDKSVESVTKLGEAAEESFGVMEVAMGTLVAGSISGFVDEIARGELNFKSFAKSFLIEISKMIAQAYILKALSATSFGASIGLGSAKGNVFDGGSLVPFASGGIVTSPTVFPMASGGVGLMGEAGPEAIMPLTRTNNGDLGVKTEVSVNITNNAGVDVQARQNGNDVEILINRVASDIARGGSAIARSMETAYGVNRARGTI